MFKFNSWTSNEDGALEEKQTVTVFFMLSVRHEVSNHAAMDCKCCDSCVEIEKTVLHFYHLFSQKSHVLWSELGWEAWSPCSDWKNIYFSCKSSSDIEEVLKDKV